MHEDVERKLKIENLTRCVNCLRFVACSEPRKKTLWTVCVSKKSVLKKVTVLSFKENV
jgi:hypothetical protein